MAEPRILRIGTRGSKLALAQATEVKAALEKAHPGLRCEPAIIRVSGDDFTAWKGGQATFSGSEARGKSSLSPLKGLFVKEIEEALLKGRIELAVHSVKDLAAELPEGLMLAAVLPRADPRDALVSPNGKGWKELPPGTRIGASSLRRQAQMKRLRRDLEFVPIKGNVDTRLRKLEAGECGALILAACGLIRLGLEEKITQFLQPQEVLPAPGQGALGIQIRQDRKDLVSLIQAVDDPDSHWEVKSERAFLKALGGGCQVPMGALGTVQGEGLTLEGVVVSPDGLKVVRKTIHGAKEAAEEIGSELASHIRAAGADRLLYGHWEKPSVVSGRSAMEEGR